MFEVYAVGSVTVAQIAERLAVPANQVHLFRRADPDDLRIDIVIDAPADPSGQEIRGTLKLGSAGMTLPINSIPDLRKQGDTMTNYAAPRITQAEADAAGCYVTLDQIATAADRHVKNIRRMRRDNYLDFPPTLAYVGRDPQFDRDQARRWLAAYAVHNAQCAPSDL